MTGSVVNLAPYGGRGRGRGKAPHRPGGARGNSSGSLLVELSCGSLLVMLFVLVSIHLGPAIFAAYANDHACRDACRNASQARDAAEAQKLVQVILKDYQAQGFIQSHCELSYCLSRLWWYSASADIALCKSHHQHYHDYAFWCAFVF
ncbi:MAG: hypothetical protein IPJ49_11445 [Candidatus Obscuribacter sp.]|nr:hypothetical protein [Candidatus Obscuribacter sp.]